MDTTDQIKSINPITNIQKDLYEVSVEKHVPKEVQTTAELPKIEVPKSEEITFTKQEIKPKVESI
jgi:hypothetical protein